MTESNYYDGVAPISKPLITQSLIGAAFQITAEDTIRDLREEIASLKKELELLKEQNQTIGSKNLSLALHRDTLLDALAKINPSIYR